MFARLTAREKEAFEEEAREEYEAELAQWQKDMDGQLSESPESRQRCIEGLVRFMQPVLDLVAEATGWKCTFMAGGPEPAHGGRLNVISVHAGTTTGDIKMNFGRAERVRYKEGILPIFGHFLKMCYTPDECRARALKPEEGFMPVDADELETVGAGLYTLDDNFNPRESSTASLPSSSSSGFIALNTASTAGVSTVADGTDQQRNSIANQGSPINRALPSGVLSAAPSLTSNVDAP
ncbi:hypothetical protein CPC08DRAFT_731758, partial [Agrocybe pediades]